MKSFFVILLTAFIAFSVFTFGCVSLQKMKDPGFKMGNLVLTQDTIVGRGEYTPVKKVEQYDPFTLYFHWDMLEMVDGQIGIRITASITMDDGTIIVPKTTLTEYYGKAAEGITKNNMFYSTKMRAVGEPGKYIFEITVYDLVSGEMDTKQATLKITPRTI